MTKEIQLTQGKVALVDDEDFEWLNQWKWHAHERHNIFYAVCSSRIDGKVSKKMHRQILNPGNDLQVDHIDGNGLNNQRINLRLCSHAQNIYNRGKLKSNTSGYIGVSWNKAKKKWSARTERNGKVFFLGYYENADDAAKAYDRHAKEFRGEFARTNFPL